MAFRDTFESCPRCGTALIDARAARGCATCGGFWVEEPVLTEMVLEMLPVPPAQLSRLQLAVLERMGDPLACPTCGAPMEATAIHLVSIDRCAKHGVWFDRDELARALERVGDPARPPPLVAHERPGEPRRAARREPVATPVTPASTPVPAEPGAPTTTLRVLPPAGEPRELVLQRGVIKIGRLASAHVRLDDPAAARLHAVLEVLAPDEVTVIDLGSAIGTTVNGARVVKATLAPGDLIGIGDTRIALVAVA